MKGNEVATEILRNLKQDGYAPENVMVRIPTEDNYYIATYLPIMGVRHTTMGIILEVHTGHDMTNTKKTLNKQIRLADKGE